MKKRTILVSALTISLLVGGGTIYGFTTRNDDKASVQSVDAPKEVKTTPQVAEPTTETIAEPAPTPVVAEPTPPPAPVYRTFDEVIASYPNMSGTAREVTCSKAIQANFPHRFTPEVTERNVRLLAEMFSSSCGAVAIANSGSGRVETPLLEARDGMGDFWDRAANRP